MFSNIRTAQNGFIFYSRLAEHDKNLYDAAFNEFNDISEEALGFDFDPSSLGNSLLQMAQTERNKETRYLRDNFGIQLSDGLTVSETSNLIRYFNERLNIDKTWELIIERLRLVQAGELEEFGNQLDPRNLISERFAYQVEQYFGKYGQSFLNQVFKIRAVADSIKQILSEAQQEGSAYAQNKLQQLFDSLIDKNPEVLRLWTEFTMKASAYAVHHIGDLYKRSPQNKKAWEEIGKRINENLILQESLIYSFGGYLANKNMFKQSVTKISNALTSGKNGSVLTPEEFEARTKSPQYKNAVKRMATQMKRSTYGNGKDRGKKRGIAAEYVMGAIAMNLEKGNNPDLKIEVAAQKTMRTGEISTVFSTDSYYFTLELPSADVIKDIVKVMLKQNKKEKGDTVLNKRFAAELTQKIEEEVFKGKDATSAILYESTKDYNITSTFSKRGFHGTSMNYASAISAFSDLLHKDKSQIQLYFNKLLNTMSGAMYGSGEGGLGYDRNKANDFLTFSLASQVGSMLFDDMYATTAGMMNDNLGIHVFRLSGMVVPLSVFLYGFAQAFLKWDGAASRAYARKWFKVSFSKPGEILYADDNYGVHPMEAWNTQRKYAINRFKVSLDFYGTFVEEILKYFPK